MVRLGPITLTDAQNKFISMNADVSLAISAGGQNTTSSVWRCGNKIVKIWKQSEFVLQKLASKLLAVHNCLSKAELAPALYAIEIIDGHLIAIFENYPDAKKYQMDQIGFSLAKAHLLLENVSVANVTPWLGFYGEYTEFSFLIPHVGDNELRCAASLLLPITKARENTDIIHYLHRDLNPTNIVSSEYGIKLIDWDMTHPGFREDDIAMSLICMLDNCEFGDMHRLASEFIAGYTKIFPTDWISLEHNIFRSAIALAGLRQGIAGWYSDEENTSAAYWSNIRHRILAAAKLLGFDIVKL